MTPDESALLQRSQAHLPQFLDELVPVLEDFIMRLGITSAPDDSSFGRYVVGKFTQAANPDMVIDIMEFALNYVNTPPPRDLMKKLAGVDRKLTRLPN